MNARLNARRHGEYTLEQAKQVGAAAHDAGADSLVDRAGIGRLRIPAGRTTGLVGGLRLTGAAGLARSAHARWPATRVRP